MFGPPHPREYLRSNFFGTILASMMNGVLSTQIYVYFRRHDNKDSIWLKCLVATSGIISFVGLIPPVFYFYAQTLHQGDTKWVPSGIAAFVTSLLMTGAQTAIVEGFFGWRASRFIGSDLFFKGVIISVVIQFCANVAAVFLNTLLPKVVAATGTDPTCTIFAVLSSVTDITISAILCYHLMKRRTGHADSDNLISKVSRLTLQTGLLCFSWGLASVILFATNQLTNAFVLSIPTPALYAINLLAALNSRLSSEEKPAERPVTGPTHLNKTPMAISAVTTLCPGIQSSLESGSRSVGVEGNNVEQIDKFKLTIRQDLGE